MIDTDKLLDNLNISDVIETYTGQQIKRGRTLCPFHEDHRASLTIKDNVWTCWVCGIGGNAINFTRRLYGLPFVEACEKLSHDFHIDDIGLWSEAGPKQDVWIMVEHKVKEQRRQDIRQLREEIDKAVDTLTAVHRVLYHLGHEEAAARYAALLDNIRDSDLYTAYKLIKNMEV